MRRAILSVLFLGAVLMPRGASAVGTRTFELDTLEALSGGDLKGVSVGSDGVVRAGWTLGGAPLEGASAVFTALPIEGSADVLVGTSPDGRVWRVHGDRAEIVAETGELAVTSLAYGPGGAVYAATMPNGKVWKLAAGKALLFATLKSADHVWALAADKGRTALYAATGPEGLLYRLGPDGSASVYFDSEEPHLVSLAVDPASGAVFAGSSGKAILHRITGPGRASVLYDFPGDEVKALAVGPGGTLYAIANEYSEPPEPPKRGAAAGRVPAAQVTAARPKPGKGSLYRFDARGRPEKMLHHDEFHYTALAVDGALAYVGTGAEGRVYAVDDAHLATLVADTDERQVGALGVGAAAFVATSDPATFRRVVGQGGADAVWTSRALDAGLRARFGRLTYRAAGALEVSTRTGETEKPDATWSAWSAALAVGAPVPSPPGRYVQVRARFAKDPRATLREVLVPFVTDNVRPVVLEVTAEQKGAARESKEGLVASGGEPPKHDSVVKVAWKVDNPDSDALRYRLTFRRDGQSMWRDVHRPDEVVTKTEYEWDTLALPEGKYRVRVEASDEPANPPSEVQKHALESATVLIDNTPPRIEGLAVRGRHLRARVLDALGPVARVELAVDGRLDWRPLAPVDGVFDTADEIVDADVSSLVGTGNHLVALRAYDAAGNAVIAEVETVP